MAKKLNLGSGDEHIPGFISVDLYDESADVKADITELPFDDDSIDEVVAYQVIEHIPYWKEAKIFSEMYRVLKPGGKAVVECPDMEYIARHIIDSGDIADRWVKSIYGQYYRPWDIIRYKDAEDHEGSKHRNAFTFGKIRRLCVPLGFTVRRRDLAEKHPAYQYEENLSVELIK